MVSPTHRTNPIHCDYFQYAKQFFLLILMGQMLLRIWHPRCAFGTKTTTRLLERAYISVMQTLSGGNAFDMRLMKSQSPYFLSQILFTSLEAAGQ